MNWKLATAFSAGAVLASGIVYMAVAPAAAPKRVEMPVVAAPPPPLVVAKTAEVPEKPAVPETVAPPAPAPVAAPTPKPPREKPSPISPPVRREKPAMVARNQPVVREPAPSPVPESRRVDPPPQPAPVAEPPQVTPPPAPEIPAPAPPAAVGNVIVEANRPEPEPEGRVPHTVTLTSGTSLRVRIGETISASRNQPGDSFLATLDQPLVIDGFIIAERGSRLEGRVIDTGASGHMSGNSKLEVSLVRLSTSDGQRIRIHTAPYRKDAGGSTGSDVAKIGAGAAIGAAIGAIAGGGKGAAIGAAAGTAAGAGTVLVAHSRSIEIPVETRLTFRIQEPVTITEKLN